MNVWQPKYSKLLIRCWAACPSPLPVQQCCVHVVSADRSRLAKLTYHWRRAGLWRDPNSSRRLAPQPCLLDFASESCQVLCTPLGIPLTDQHSCVSVREAIDSRWTDSQHVQEQSARIKMQQFCINFLEKQETFWINLRKQIGQDQFSWIYMLLSSSLILWRPEVMSLAIIIPGLL